MANIFVRSTDGDNADNGSTWALAKATLAGAAAIDAAGDTIYVSQVHAESNAAAQTISLAGTIASPVRVICGNDAAEPPTATATTGTVTTTGANDIVISGNAYIYGLSFFNGTGAGTTQISLQNGGGTKATYENCHFEQVDTSSGSRIRLCSSADSNVELKNCTFKFGNSGQGFSWAQRTIASIRGGSIAAGGSAITTVFYPSTISVIEVEAFDFSQIAASANIFASNGAQSKFVMRNCKLPASWTGSLNSSTPGNDSVYEMHNCDSGDTNYRLWRKTQFGDVTHETTLIKTGGASDGDVGLSWKMVSNADPEFPYQTLKSPEIVKRNATVGSAITVTVDVLHDSLTNIQDDEIWLEVQYLGTSGFPLGSFIDDAAADVLATPADQTASSATWTTTGMTNPNKQKLAVTFTPQEKGYIHAVVHLAKASYTVYVDPVLQVS